MKESVCDSPLNLRSSVQCAVQWRLPAVFAGYKPKRLAPQTQSNLSE